MWGWDEPSGEDGREEHGFIKEEKGGLALVGIIYYVRYHGQISVS